MPQHVVEESFAVGQFLLNIHCHLILDFVPNANASDHGFENRHKQALLVRVNFLEVHDLSGLLKDLAGFARVDTILKVVSPALFLRHVGGDLAFILPVNVPIAVEGGNESQALGERTEHAVLGDHRILAVLRDEVPVALDVLSIVQAVLPAHPDVGVGEELVQSEDQDGFLVGGPVPLGLAASHQRNADGVGPGPAESDTVNVPVARLDIEVQPQRKGTRPCVGEEAAEGRVSLMEGRANEKAPLGLVVPGAGSHVPLDSPEVVEDGGPLGPFAHHCAGGEGGDDFDSLGGGELAAAPLEDAPLASQGP